MTADEGFMIGGMVGLSIGITVGAVLVRHTMIPETRVIALQQCLWHAIGAVRTAMMNLSVTDYGEALESAERHLEHAGAILQTNLRDNGDR